MSSNKPILTISILISNRLDTIRRCLDSLAPLMKSLSCELILVDTSGNPEVNAICHEYTDQVEKFTWCNDFSKARNTGLKRASGEWFMFLDDDEWIVEYEPFVEFFKSGEYRSFGAANYIVRNFMDKDYINYSDSWVSRMIRIEDETEFRSKIHEYMYPVTGDIKNIYGVVNHSGYVYATEEEKLKHFERNASLLLKMIEEEPQSLRWQTQLVQEYRFIKKWKELADFSEKCLRGMDSLSGYYTDMNAGTFYAGWIEALINLKEYDKAIEICKKAFGDARKTDLAEAFHLVQYADLLAIKGDYKECELCAKHYFRIKKKMEKNQKVYEEQQSALLITEAFDDVKVKKVYYLLMMCGIHLGKKEYLDRYFPLLNWGEKVVYVANRAVEEFTYGIATMEYLPVFSEMLTLGFSNRMIRGLFIAEIEKWKEKEETGYQRILYAFAKSKANYWYRWYAKIINNFEDIEEFTFEKWKEYTNAFMQVADDTEVEQVSTRLMEVSHIKDVQVNYFLLQLTIREIKLLDNYAESYEQVRRLLSNFVEIVLDYYSNVYQEHMFIDSVELMPEEVQIAKQILTYLEYEEKDPKRAVHELKVCVDISVEYANMVKTVYKYLA